MNFSFERLFTIGLKLANSGNYEEAISFFEKALAIKEDPRVYFQQAILLAELDRYLEADACINKAIALNSRNPVFYLFYGIFQYDLGNYQEALAKFNKSIELDKNNLLSISYRGLTLLNLGKIEDGLKILKKNLKHTNPSFQSRLLLFCESYLKDRLDESLMEMLGLTLPYVNQEKLYHAPALIIANLLKRILSWLTFYLQSFFVLVRYFRDKDKEKRLAFSYFLKGSRFEKINDFEHSLAEYMKAIVVNPEFYLVRKKVADILCLKRQYEFALEHFEKLLSSKDKEAKDIFAQDYSFFLEYGITLYYLKRYREAKNSLEIACFLDEQDFLSYYYLGKCSYMLNEVSLSRKYFQKAVESLNPNLAERLLEVVIRFLPSE